jgi:hypothetical protein
MSDYKTCTKCGQKAMRLVASSDEPAGVWYCNPHADELKENNG